MITKHLTTTVNVCYYLTMKSLNLIGKKFNKLIVVDKAPKQSGKTIWKCVCDCGNTTYVMTSNLTCNRTKSCGCLKDEKLVQRSTKHNQRHTNLYEVWKSIKQRCFNVNNKSYKNYGARGITLCEDWKTNFKSFYKWSIDNGYQKGLTIDRIDNNGNYCPENCRWVDRQVQCNNTRCNKIIIFNGESKTLADWCRILNISYSCMSSRLRNGWSIERAFTTVPRVR